MATAAPAKFYVRCGGQSGLLSLLRWSSIGFGILWGFSRQTHYHKVKTALLIQKKEAYEHEIHELKGALDKTKNDYHLLLAQVNDPVGLAAKIRESEANKSNLLFGILPRQ